MLLVPCRRACGHADYEMLTCIDHIRACLNHGQDADSKNNVLDICWYAESQKGYGKQGVKIASSVQPSLHFPPDNPHGGLHTYIKRAL